MNGLKEAFLNIVSQISSIGFFDIADIIIVTVIFYYTYRFVRDRRAGKLAFGILLIVLIMMFSNLLGMQVLSFIIENVVQVGMIGVIILFQPELRAFLEKMGGPNVFSNLKKKNPCRVLLHVLMPWLMRFPIFQRKKRAPSLFSSVPQSLATLSKPALSSMLRRHPT